MLITQDFPAIKIRELVLFGKCYNFVSHILLHMTYTAADSRYDGNYFRRCGNSGLVLPLVSLGLWHNFGDVDDMSHYSKIMFKAFDNGVTHFDLANNYGPPAGSAEKNFGSILARSFSSYRDEMIIST